MGVDVRVAFPGGRAYAFLLGLVLALTPAGARAEFFVDLYGGLSWTRPTDVDIRGIDILGVPVDVTLDEVQPNRSGLGGLRLGYWFDFLPDLGVAVDLFYFEPSIKRQTVRATASVTGEIFDEIITVSVAGPAEIPSAWIPAGVVSADLMVRWRLFQDGTAPHGRVQPFLLAGPAFLITDHEDFGTSLGVKTGGGVAWQLTRWLAVFAEYRFTHFTPTVETGGLRYKATVSTHHALVGLSFRF
jgi:hypothetical protein